MDTGDEAILLGQAVREHRRLVRRARHTDAADFASVLALGSAICMHGLVELSELYEANRYLDPSVVVGLRDEHRRLAEHLSFFEELLESRPDSADLTALSSALLERLRAHLERDERVLYGPLARLSGRVP